MTYCFRKCAFSILAAAVGAMSIQPAGAQMPARTAADADETVSLDRFVITGSNIPTAADAVAVPVVILGPDQLERTGITSNMLELVRKRLPMFAGNGNLGNTNANTANNSTSGGSQASLRNLDTLVLINGRRVGASAANARGGRNFADLNLIPLAAVESIEVLTDGASAIYGSDAVGGVINVKLKRDLDGGAIGVRHGVAKSGYNESSAYAVVGTKKDRASLTAAVSWSKTDPLLQKDRPFSAEIYGKTASISGVVFPSATAGLLDPSLNSPRERNPVGLAATANSFAELLANGTYSPTTPADIANSFNISPHVTLLMSQEQKGLMLNGELELAGGRLVLFSDVLHTRSDSALQLAAQPIGVTLRAGAPYNPLTVNFPGISMRYLGTPRILTNDASLSRATFGLRGELARNWNWETAYVYNGSEVDLGYHNAIYGPNVARAVAGGYNAQGVATPGGAYSRVIVGFDEASTEWAIQPALDPLARDAAVDPASLANLYGTARGRLSGDLETWDAKVTGTPFVLPGGDLGVAAGVVYMRESLEGAPEEAIKTTVRRWQGVSYFDNFTRSRDVKAAFAEVRLPVAGPDWSLPGLRALDLTAAYRWEDYSDAGQSEVPKFGVRWQPLDEQLTLRYTYSEAFTAPSLYYMFGPQLEGAVSAQAMRTVFGAGYDAAQYRAGSNPNLRPSTAKTHSFGFVVSPRAVKGLTLSVDYVEAKQVDLISTIGTTLVMQSVEQLGPQSPYISQVTLEAFPGEAGAVPITRAGQLGEFLRAGNRGNRIYIFDGLTNVAGATVRAVDVNLEYRRPLRWGTMELSTTGTFFLDYRFQALPSEPFFEYAGHATVGGTGSEGTIPGYRFYTVASLEREHWGLMIGHTYIPSVTDIGPGGMAYVTSATLSRIRVDSFQAWDLQLTCRMDGWARPGREWLRGLRFTVGANNVFDEMAPSARQAFVEAYADVSTYGAIGRLVYASASLKF